ncbi:hypothetical protein [Nocardioides litoris]|uniref:hypothetical protein n=1 Tax=Nocardioides litoris TaxID=1926648 RepID=UPI00111F209E|nr:hypothetical protein [Nocardioides litoris]
MNHPAGLLAIPWRYVDLDLIELWVWETDHFEAKVTAEPHSFAWEVGDLVVPDGGVARWLTGGRTIDFASAEVAVREVVGKSYPARYGYRGYAGHLATTFVVADGRTLDLGPFHGSRALVTVRMPGGADQSFLGRCTVHHYELLLALDSGQQVRIQPSYIVDVTGENGATAASATAYAGVGRTYHGEVVHGCTGAPAFLPGTVEHTGTRCPVHESTVPRTAEVLRPA